MYNNARLITKIGLHTPQQPRLICVMFRLQSIFAIILNKTGLVGAILQTALLIANSSIFSLVSIFPYMVWPCPARCRTPGQSLLSFSLTVSNLFIRQQASGQRKLWNLWHKKWLNSVQGIWNARNHELNKTYSRTQVTVSLSLILIYFTIFHLVTTSCR